MMHSDSQQKLIRCTFISAPPPLTSRSLSTVDYHAVEQEYFSTLYNSLARSLNLTTVHSYPGHGTYFVLILKHSPMHVQVSHTLVLQRSSTACIYVQFIYIPLVKSTFELSNLKPFICFHNILNNHTANGTYSIRSALQFKKIRMFKL